MIKTIKYGPYTFTPWTKGNGYIDGTERTSKFVRNKEPQTLWRGLEDETKELTLHVCPSCFLYSSLEQDTSCSLHKCRITQPPGVLCYDSPEYSIYEVCAVDESSRLFLQCLSLFGRLFLDTKSVCYLLDGFLFYTLYDKQTNYCAGFFSKEKSSWYDYNLACIIVFPAFQKRSLGNLLIGFSYYLSRQAGKPGSPEKPLSRHGLAAYTAYWCSELCHYFLSGTKVGSITDISRQTGIITDDIVGALEHMDAISIKDKKTQIDAAKILEYYNCHKTKRIFDEQYINTPVAPTISAAEHQ